MPRRSDIARLALVVEDEAILALQAEEVLEAAGFSCIHATEQAEVEAECLDDLAVAVIELRLRGNIEGPDIIRLLRERVGDLPVVVVTAYDVLAPSADLRGTGGPTMRLSKPASQEELAEAVRTALEHRQRGMRMQPGRRHDDAGEVSTY